MSRNRFILCGLLPVLLWLPAAAAQQPDKKPSTGKVDEAWIKQVQKLSADAQVQAVINKLKELNPGFDGKAGHKIEKGAVTELHFVSDAVTDISPVRALTQLKALSCNGSGPGKGKLADLSPLKGLPLTGITVASTQVSDLSPLNGMALGWFSCGGTRVTDFSPLKGMPITHLYCQGLDPSLELLRSMPRLTIVNNSAAADYMRQLALWEPDPRKELSVAGVLTAKDPFDRLRPGCHHKVHEFKMKAGITYVIDQIGPVDAYLRLEDSKGVQLAEDDDSGGNQHAAIVFTPKKTDTYRLIVTTCDQGQVGKYLLEAQPLKGANRPGRTGVAARTVPIGQIIYTNNQLKKNSPYDPKRKDHYHAVWTYQLTAGSKYAVGLDSGAFFPYLRLEDAAGKKQLDEDFTVDGFQTTLINFTPKESGIYRIIVSSVEPGATGYYQLSLRNLNPGESPPLKQVRFLTPYGNLTKESKIDPLRPRRHHNVHTFKGTAGKKYAIHMSPAMPSFGSYIRLEDANGKNVKKDEDPEDVQRPLIVFQAQETGTYKVVASSVEPGKLGGYNLQIRPLGPTEPAPTKQFNSILNAPHQITQKDPEDKVREGCHHKVHPFRMKGDVKYVVDVIGQQWNNQWLDACLRLEDSAGKILAQDDLSQGNDNPRIIFQPKKTDTYNIVVVTEKPVVADQFGVMGQYSLTARALAPGESPPPHPGGGYYVPPSPPPAPQGFYIGKGKAAKVGDNDVITITPLPGPAYNFGGGSNEEAHGYVEFRFAIENRSAEAHRVQLTIPRFPKAVMGRYGHYLQSIKRSVEVQPKATVILSLFQPDLSLSLNNGVEVEIDGQVRNDFLNLNFSHQNRGQRFRDGPGGSSNNMLHILAAADQAQMLGNNVFKTAVGRPPTKRRASSTTGSMFAGTSYTYHQIHQIHGLPLQGNRWSTSWLGYSSYDGVVLTSPQLKDLAPEVKNALWQYVECGGSLLLIGEGKLPESWQRNQVKGKSWSEYYPGFGQCLVFPKTRMRALTPEQWGLIADMWDQGDQPWKRVRSPGEAQRDFPVVDNIGIPVRGLFVVMLVFAVLIGPVNIRVLTRKKRRIWLLWTVPAFSVLTCVLVVGFMFVSEGWYARARVAGLVFLDEPSQRASALSGLGIYTTMSAGDGLHFSQDTEITPHLRMERFSNQRHARTIDWTNDQHLDSGWIAPRLPAHFMVRTGEKRLERVLVRRGNDGSLMMTNGLKAPVQSIWLADMKGRIYFAADVPEGGEAVLKATDQKAGNQPAALRKLFAENWFKLPGICALPGNREQMLRPGCYLAILEGAPFLETGMSNVRLRPEATAVFGIMKEPL